MSIYAIADLHLPFGVNKPMDIFGSSWDNYTSRLYENWNNTVLDDDTVIIPGDLSWATYIKESYLDFKFLNELPGKKIITKGNHDYFFTTMTKMNDFLKSNNFDTISILQNNFFFVEGISICGTRGWDVTSSKSEDLKLVEREAIRLELSLKAAIDNDDNAPIYAFLHYPPIYQNANYSHNKIIEILEKYNVINCYYGHLHSSGIKTAFIGNNNNVNFSLISADYLSFNPKKIT